MSEPKASFAKLPEADKARRRARVRVLIPTGVGLNCEIETETGFRRAGASPERVPITDLLDRTQGRRRWTEYQIVAFIGGFAFGDHLGAGFVLANRIRFRLYDDLLEFVSGGGLALGICNGFQTMVRLGVLPGFDGDYRTPRATLAPNDRLGYRNAWVKLAFDSSSPCIWTRGLTTMDLPSRHGEGKFLTQDDGVFRRLVEGRQIAARYAGSDGRETEEWPANPNGSPGGVAGVCDPSGRLFGLMPHPDAYLDAFHHPLWTRRKLEGTLPAEGDGMKIFRNGVDEAAARL